MKKEYYITENDLHEKGIILSDYARDTTAIPAIIQIALDQGVTRVLYLNDDFEYEEDIEHAIDKNPKLLPAFKKMQFQIIYNLLFVPDNETINANVDRIISSDLRWCKINGWQKQLF